MYVRFKQDFSCFRKNEIVDVAYVFADLLINELKVAETKKGHKKHN